MSIPVKLSAATETSEAEQLRLKQWLKMKAEVECDASIKSVIVPAIDKIIESENGSDILCQKFNLAISRADLELLSWKPNKWLNDNLINFYMELVNERSKHNPLLPKVYAFNTFFAKKLSEGVYNYNNVRRWTKRLKLNIFSCQKVFFPINYAKHWALIIAHMDRKRIEYYDSLGGKNHGLLYRVQEYFFDEHQDKLQKPWDDEGWNFEIAEGPYQENWDDCGVFVCTYVDLTSLEYPIFMRQHNMQFFRQKILAEITSNKLHVQQTCAKIRETRVCQQTGTTRNEPV